MEFPSYFRKLGRCVKVLSPTRLQIIVLPPDADVAERFTTSFPDESRLVKWLTDFAPVDEGKWNEFLSTFHQQVCTEREKRIKETVFAISGTAAPAKTGP